MKKSKKLTKERGSIALCLLVSILFFIIIGYSIYANVANSLSAQEKEIKAIQKNYQENSTEEIMDEKYEELLDGKIRILFHVQSTGELYQNDKWINQNLIMTIYYPEEVPEDERYFSINGDKKTGITLMYTVKEMDAGNIIFQQSIDILENDTYKTMLIKLTNLAQEMIKKHFFDLLSNNVKSIEQDNNKVTKGFNIKKEDEIINFNDFINNIDCKIRGLFDKPIAKFKYLNNLYKIHHASKTMTKSTKDPATIVEINKNGIFVATKDFDICLDLIQQPNKKPMYVKDIINGHHEFKIGEKLI